MTAPTSARPTETVDHMIASLKPVIEEHRAEGEVDRNLPEPILRAMMRAGVFQAVIPKAFGGLELDLVSYYQLVERIANLDASSGWVAANNSGFPYMFQSLPPEGAKELLATPDLLVAGGGFPPGTAIPVEGGYRITGKASFGSATKWANWLWSLMVVLDDGQPRLGPDGQPALLWCFFPADRANRLDNWNTMGMRGTGSHDYTYDGIFVPARHTFMLAPFATPGPGFEGPLYRGAIWPIVIVLGAVALGIGRAAVDEGVKLAKEKTPSYVSEGLATSSAVQRLLGRAEAQVSAARAYVYDVTGSIWEASVAGRKPSLEEGVQAQLAASFAMEAGVAAVDRVHEVVGTSGVRNELRFQQLFRDMHTFSQHAFGSVARFDSAAKVMLGRQSDWGFFYL